MATPDGRPATGDVAGDERVPVTVHRSSPDRVVFVEQNNPDAWIATDLTVDPPE
jgi:hypothetical protein